MKLRELHLCGRLRGVAPSHEGAWIEIIAVMPMLRKKLSRPLTRGGVD